MWCDELCVLGCFEELHAFGSRSLKFVVTQVWRRWYVRQWLVPQLGEILQWAQGTKRTKLTGAEVALESEVKGFSNSRMCMIAHGCQV